MQEVSILQLMSLSHGSSKRACQVLLSLAIHGGSMASSLDKDTVGDASYLWKPLVMTVIWPLAEMARYSPFLEDLMSEQTLGHADMYRENLRNNGFEKN
jgi:hypothetical protein